MELLENFRENLKKQGHSANTIKNYVSDLSTFVDFLEKQNQYFSILTLPFILNNQFLSNYKNWLKDRNPLVTNNRRLSALRKFINFAIKSELVSASYTGKVINFELATIQNPVTDIEKFQKFLVTEQSSANTIKNYISDIKYYLKLTNVASESPSSIRRRYFSVKKYLSWKNKKLLSEPEAAPIQNLNTGKIHAKTNAFSWDQIFIMFGGLLVVLGLTLLFFQTYPSTTKFLTNRPWSLHELVIFLRDLTIFVVHRITYIIQWLTLTLPLIDPMSK